MPALPLTLTLPQLASSDPEAIRRYCEAFAFAMQRQWTSMTRTLNALSLVDTLANRSATPELDHIVFTASDTGQMYVARGGVWYEFGPGAGAINWIGAGASPLGLVNARTAIQATITALADGGISFGPPGDFLVTSAITGAAGVVIAGSGYASNVTIATAAEHNIIEIGAVANWEVRDLRLTGGGVTTGTRHGLLMTGSSDGAVDRLICRDVDSSSIYVLDGDRIQITRANIVGIAGQGNAVYVNGGRNIIISHVIARVGKFGIAIVGPAPDPASSRQSENITVTACAIADMTGVTGTGVDVNDAIGVTVGQTTVDGCENVGIQFKNPTGDDTKHNVAVGNIVSDTGGNGMYCQDGSRSEFLGNKVYRSGAHGILVRSAPYQRVEHNGIYTTGEDGIELDASDDGNITDNHVEGVPSGAAIASGVQAYTDGTNPANDETFIVGDITYTIKTALTGAAYEILRGADADATMTNLCNAINDTVGTEGTDYGLGTLPHPWVSATIDTGADTLTLTALAAGPNGNETVTSTLAGVTKANVTGGDAYACVRLTGSDRARLDGNTLVIGSADYHLIIDKDCAGTTIGPTNSFVGTLAISDRGTNTKYPDRRWSALINLSAAAPANYYLDFSGEGFYIGRMQAFVETTISGTVPVVEVGSLADSDGYVLAMRLTGTAGDVIELPINGALGRTVATTTAPRLRVTTAATAGRVHILYQGVRRQ